jgi:UDP-glucose 4-epimerase
MHPLADKRNFDRNAASCMAASMVSRDDSCCDWGRVACHFRWRIQPSGLLAAERAPDLGFRNISSAPPHHFHRDDLERLRIDAPAVLRERVPDYEAVYRDLQWKMFPGIWRVYVNERARKELGWLPRYDFPLVIRCLKAGVDFRSPLARSVGSKGYHDKVFSQGPYPVE